MRKLILALAVALTATLAACGSDGGTDSSVIPDDAVVIDVRTPEEYAEGHLEGALNINLQDPDFKGQVGPLDRDGKYVVYCRSGNRSGQAKAIMEEMGFTDVTNAGAYEDLR